jgi:hypothetical protein
MAMNNQEAFDKIYEFAKNQTERSTHPNGGMCAYNSANGNHCYVGVLIKGIELSSSEESLNFYELVNSNKEVVKRLLGVSRQFLFECQNVHDNKHLWGEGKTKNRLAALKEVGKRHDIKVP